MHVDESSVVVAVTATFVPPAEHLKKEPCVANADLRALLIPVEL